MINVLKAQNINNQKVFKVQKLYKYLVMVEALQMGRGKNI
jgi:hypothetical protein